MSIPIFPSVCDIYQHLTIPALWAEDVPCRIVPCRWVMSQAQLEERAAGETHWIDIAPNINVVGTYYIPSLTTATGYSWRVDLAMVFRIHDAPPEHRFFIALRPDRRYADTLSEYNRVWCRWANDGAFPTIPSHAGKGGLMSKKHDRPRKAGRPAPQARRVYEDWVHGVHVHGWEYSSGDLTYLTFTRHHTGSVVCTATYIREWWEGLDPVRKSEAKTSLVEKALASRSAVGSRGGATDSTLRESAPTLHEFLTLCELSDGRTRSTSSLLVFTEGGLWKAVLNERDAELSLWATAESLQGLFLELETRLTAPAVDWRPSRRPGGVQARQGVDRKPRG